MALTRRNLLGHAGGAYLASAMVAGTSLADASVSATISPNAELARLIEAQRTAYEALGAYCDELSAAERAFYDNRSNAEARQARDDAYRVQVELSTVERAAFVALLSYLCRDLAELRTVVAIGKETCWHGSGPDDEEVDALLAGIMGGPAS